MEEERDIWTVINWEAWEMLGEVLLCVELAGLAGGFDSGGSVHARVVMSWRSASET